MASSRQQAFFRELVNDREFPSGVNTDTMVTQFDGLSQDSASEWIEKALTLPKKDSGKGDNVPPPF